MTRLMLSRKLERWEPVIVDVESYRVRRRRQLRQLAARMAEKVAFSKQRVVLEAMPANERRIIHIALRDHPQVMTRSVGEGEHRKVTIIPK
jgi:spoIIIJ-associated protein